MHNGGVPVTQGAATAKLKGLGVVSFNVTNPGAGYQSAPTVAIAAPPASVAGQAATSVQAAGTANIASQSTPAAYSLALDANDEVYVGWQNAAGTTGANSFVTATAANGTPLYTTTPSTTLTAPRGAAADSLGHLWLAENNGNTVLGLNTADGSTYKTLTTTNVPFGLGVDKLNNVWYGTAASAGVQNLFQFTATGAAYTNVNFTNLPVFTQAVRAIAFDPNQNVYVSGFNANTASVGGLGNTGTAAAPTYANTGSGNNAIVTTITGANGAAIALDSAAHAWAATSTGLFNITPTDTGITLTALTAPTTPITEAATTPGYDEVDGAGSIWLGANLATGVTGESIVQYVQGTGAANSYQPCYAAAGATTCSTASLNQPQRVQVDSTGSVWITSLNNGRVYQLLGTGAPTWPLAAYTAPGVTPQ